ncbi:hypothetical protein OVA24_08675 [Luteolibacter sp. SL250]|uniref:hypothetical protein n=1 Tax=Luteolibacter sp. SL250 TaxID=2995170 RepID=UPI00226FE61F|nr:hypothetical protein [Luteolibacter sp. SL250]WAC21459.1 hypothetical protein OVA24_08675 [Luteolibacter sp. SL250]
MNSRPPHPPQVPPLPRKGLSGPAWVGIGCGALVVVIILVVGALGFVGVRKFKEFQANKELAVAEMIIATHPDLEKVSADPEKGEITVRSKSGEVYTVNYKEITEGRFSFKDSAGNTARLGGSTDLSEVPAWVPRPPSISGTPTVFHAVTDGKAGGMYNATSTVPFDDLETFFNDELTKAGFGAATSNRSTWGGNRTASRSVSTADREVTVNLTMDARKPVTIQVIYKEK